MNGADHLYCFPCKQAKGTHGPIVIEKRNSLSNKFAGRLPKKEKRALLIDTKKEESPSLSTIKSLLMSTCSRCSWYMHMPARIPRFEPKPSDGDIRKCISYKHVKVLCCRAFVHVPKTSSPNSTIRLNHVSILVSHSHNEFGYRLWGPEAKKIFQAEIWFSRKIGLLRTSRRKKAGWLVDANNN